MKALHHPASPCDLSPKGNLKLQLKDLPEDLEVVECNEGLGVFTKREFFWAEKGEVANRRVLPAENKFDINGWGFYSPMEIELELTKNCNQECIHCWNDSFRTTGELEFEKLKILLAEFKKNHGQKLKLIGGEPMMYKHFWDLLDFSKGNGIRQIEMTSNGRLITKNIADKLITSLTDIFISLHGSNSKIHNYITQRERSYEETIKGIKHMQDKGMNPSLRYTIMGKNKGDALDMLDLAEDLNVKSIKFNALIQKGRGANIDNISLEDLFLLRNLVYSESKKRNVKLEKSVVYTAGYMDGIEYARFYGCSGLRSCAYISSNGDMLPCSLVPTSIGNIYEQSLNTLWRNSLAQKFRDTFDCENSSCQNTCGGKCKA